MSVSLYRSFVYISLYVNPDENVSSVAWSNLQYYCVLLEYEKSYNVHVQYSVCVCVCVGMSSFYLPSLRAGVLIPHPSLWPLTIFLWFVFRFFKCMAL